MRLRVLILAAVLSLSAIGATVTVTMDEVVPNTPVNGVVITKPGISFTFQPQAGTCFSVTPSVACRRLSCKERAS